MYVLLEILGLVATILIISNRFSNSGVSLPNLNPFQWARRRKWVKNYNADPLFSMDNPMEATAGLMYVMAKSSGDISKEQKQCMVDLFQSEFKLPEQQARELLSSCAFLFRDEDKVVDNLKDFLKPSLPQFDTEKRDSALEMIGKVGDCEGTLANKQIDFLKNVTTLLAEPVSQNGKW